MGRVVLLANPEAGSGGAEPVERELRADGAELATYPIDDAQPALESDPERIVVAGGDGSIGAAAALAARAGVPLAVVPVGTANDFARALGVPGELERACRLAVSGASTRAIELGRMDGRPFVNVASIGLPPVAARRARGLKRWMGPLSYAVGAVGAGLRAKPVDCRVMAAGGDEAFAGRAWQATVACSGAFGGGARLETDSHDGQLDAVVLEAGSRAGLLRRAYGMRSGRLEGQRGVRHRRAPSFVVEVGPDTAFNVDGELAVRSGPVRFTVEPAAVEVVVG
jgi:diacylglycerol kinase (ATP)